MHCPPKVSEFYGHLNFMYDKPDEFDPFCLALYQFAINRQRDNIEGKQTDKAIHAPSAYLEEKCRRKVGNFIEKIGEDEDLAVKIHCLYAHNMQREFEVGRLFEDLASRGGAVSVLCLESKEPEGSLAYALKDVFDPKRDEDMRSNIGKALRAHKEAVVFCGKGHVSEIKKMASRDKKLVIHDVTGMKAPELKAAVERVVEIGRVDKLAAAEASSRAVGGCGGAVHTEVVKGEASDKEVGAVAKGPASRCSNAGREARQVSPAADHCPIM